MSFSLSFVISTEDGIVFFFFSISKRIRSSNSKKAFLKKLHFILSRM